MGPGRSYRHGRRSGRRTTSPSSPSPRRSGQWSVRRACASCRTTRACPRRGSTVLVYPGGSDTRRQLDDARRPRLASLSRACRRTHDECLLRSLVYAKARLLDGSGNDLLERARRAGIARPQGRSLARLPIRRCGTGRHSCGRLSGDRHGAPPRRAAPFDRARAGGSPSISSTTANRRLSNDQNLWTVLGRGDVKRRTFPRMI